MAFGSFEREPARPMAEINTTPLVDVMLVLLVIFMVTAPLFTHAVKIDLPRARGELNVERPATIALAIDAAGRLYWNDEPISEASLSERFARAAAASPQPELHLRADQDTRYQVIARIMAGAQRAGLRRIGLVTVPDGKQR